MHEIKHNILSLKTNTFLFYRKLCSLVNITFVVYNKTKVNDYNARKFLKSQKIFLIYKKFASLHNSTR